MLQTNSASYNPECLVPGPDADTHTGSDGEKCARRGDGVPMHVSPVSHVLWLRRIHAGHHRV